MKKFFFNSLATSAMLALLISFSFTSCKKDAASEPQYSQPVVPAAETMQMVDFSSIDQVTSKSKVNILVAKVELSFWSGLIYNDLKVPVAVFGKALAQTPTKVETNKWLWQYSATVGITSYSVKLYGTAQTDSTVAWQLSVNDVVYVNGLCKKDGTSGTWTLNKKASTPALKEEWTYNATNKTGTVKYTAIETGATYTGSYLSLTKTNSTPYNVNFEAYLQNNGTTPATIHQLNIDWNSTSKEGRYKFKAESTWKYWDASFNDIIN